MTAGGLTRALFLLSLVLLPACGRGDDPPLAEAQAAAPAAPTPADQLAQIRMLTKGQVYRGSTYADRILYKRETVRGVEFAPSTGWLGITVDDVDETAPVAVIIPLREVGVTTGAGQSTPPAAVIRFSCRSSSSCITTTAESFAQAVQKLAAAQGGALKFADRRSTFQFGCPPDRCAAIKQAIDNLVDIAAAPRSSAAPGASGLPQPQPRHTSPQAPTLTAIVAQINALTAQLDYVAPDGKRVISLRYVTTLDRGQMQLIVTRDTESFVATNPSASRITDRSTIPLSHVSVASFPKRVHKPRGWTFDVHEVGFACLERKTCVQAAARGARNDYQGYTYECDASKCLALGQALEQLIAALKAPPPAAQGPTALQRNMDGMVKRINQSINRSTWLLAGSGFSVTQGLSITADGKIAVHSHQCPTASGGNPATIEECRRSTPTGPDTVVQFSPADIDPSSIGLQSAGHRSLIIFSCRTPHTCIVSSDGQRQFRGFGIACPDATACNRLVADFTSLLDQVSGRTAKH